MASPAAAIGVLLDTVRGVLMIDHNAWQDRGRAVGFNKNVRGLANRIPKVYIPHIQYPIAGCACQCGPAFSCQATGLLLSCKNR